MKKEMQKEKPQINVQVNLKINKEIERKKYLSMESFLYYGSFSPPQRPTRAVQEIVLDFAFNTLLIYLLLNTSGLAAKVLNL